MNKHFKLSLIEPNQIFMAIVTQRGPVEKTKKSAVFRRFGLQVAIFTTERDNRYLTEEAFNLEANF